MCAMNHKEIRAVAEEWKSMEGAALKRAYQPTLHELILAFRHRGKERLLLIGIEDDHSRIHLLDNKPKSPRIPYGFVSLLRARLGVSRLERIYAVENERLLRFDFQALEDEKESRYHLAVELTGRHANAFFLDADGIILGAMRPNRSTKRSLAVGRPYAPPLPAPPKTDLPMRLDGETDDGDGFEKSRRAAALFGAAAKASRTEKREARIRREIRLRIRRLERARHSLDRDREKARQAPEWRTFADLLQIHFGALKPGLRELSVEDVIGQTGTVTIPLDPTLSPRANVERLYRRAKKADRAIPQIDRREREIEDERDHLLRLSELLDEDGEAAFSKLENALSLQPEEKSREVVKRKKETPWRRFLSASGKEIRVGRNAKENDGLTFRYAKGDDFWFHASGYAGSHVLVPIDRGAQIDPETLADAATLAAHYSKARGGGIEVSYTRARYIRKPKGAPPGQVIMSQRKTWYVDPDPERIRRLMQSCPLETQ